MADATKSQRETDLVKTWQERLDEAEKYRAQKTTFKDWDTYLDYYKGNWKSGIQAANKIFAYIRTMIPRIYFRDPVITLTATRPEYEWHARVIESLDNWLIRRLKLKKEMKLAVLDALLFGLGVIKHGYDSEFGYVKQQALQADGAALTQAGTDTVSKIEYRDNVYSGTPWSLRVDPRDILFPPGYTDPSELPWVAHRIFRLKDDCMEDPKYDETNRKKLKGGYTLQGNSYGKAKFFEKSKQDFVMLWEIRDAKYQKLLTIAEDMVLLQVEDACQLNGLPFDFIIFNPDPDSLWGLPDIKMVEHEQLELNDARTSAAKSRRISALKFLHTKGAIKDGDKEILTGEKVGAGVEVQADSIQQAIQILTGHTPNNTYQEISEIERSIRETLGHGSNQAGAPMGSGSTPHTATEVMAVDKGVEIREDERRDVLADILCSIVGKWNRMIFEYWSDQRIIQVVGPEGEQQWIRFTGQQLKDDYILRVDPDSGMPVTRTLRYQQAKEIFTMLNGDPLTNQIMLRKLLLRQSQWIDPSWSLIISEQQQTISRDTLDFMKGGNQGLPGNPMGSGPMPGNMSTAGQPAKGGPGAAIQLQMPPVSGASGSA